MSEMPEIPETTEAPGSGFDAAADLRSAREALGLSLQDIFATTRVSLINLRAVESEDFGRLPPPVYARNFIRKYARAVGVDPQPLLARYEQHLETKKPPRAEEGVRRPWPENSRRWRFLVLSLLAVILAGTLVYAVFLYDQTPPPSSPVATPAESVPSDAHRLGVTETGEVPAATVSQDVTAPATSTAPPPPAVQPPAAPAGGNYHLLLTARELTWLRITQDNTPPYEILLKPGERIERRAGKYFLLDIGNAGGLQLTFQGKDLGVPGKSGQVVHLRLPEQTAPGSIVP